MTISDFTDEPHFEQFFQTQALKYNCQYIKIPDYIKIKGNKVVAHKRPFDGILITHNYNICCELKMNYAKLKKHQWQYLTNVYNKNRLAVVIRAIKTKQGIKFRLDNPATKKVYLECRKIESLFLWFNQIKLEKILGIK